MTSGLAYRHRAAGAPGAAGTRDGKGSHLQRLPPLVVALVGLAVVAAAVLAFALVWRHVMRGAR
jgi:hypothetical protein